ncbi:hypothetical protein HOD29_00915 [archaeon]|jgi:predicted DNA binding protein|nr:hypothetical protein [archaeon]
MWAAKFLVYDEEGIYSSRAKKFNIGLSGYPLNYYSDKKYFYFIALGFLDGKEKIKKVFLDDLKKDKRVHNLEFNDSFFICITKETINAESKRLVKLFYNPLLIRTKPVKINSEGWEENEVVCFERKFIGQLIKISEKKYNLKLKYFKQTKLQDIGVLNVFPNLTAKQQRAMDSAIDNGYYQYPRNIDVKTLAKKNKLSFSTFQEHLRKAENKLIPSFRKM